MIKPLFFSAFLFIAASGFGQVHRPQSKEEMITVCGKFMDMFKIGKYDQAFDMLKSYSVIENYKLDTLASTVTQQMKTVNSSYGKTLGYDLVSDKQVKNSVIKLVYLVKFEQSFIELHFLLYNNGSGWTVTNFKYDEETTDLF